MFLTWAVQVPTRAFSRRRGSSQLTVTAPLATPSTTRGCRKVRLSDFPFDAIVSVAPLSSALTPPGTGIDSSIRPVSVTATPQYT